MSGDRKRHEELKEKYRAAFLALREILLEADPEGIGHLKDEYDPEAAAILAKLKDCRSSDDAQKAVSDTFEKWFGERKGTADKSREIAERIWSEVMPHLV
jgi:hypothetical protein